MAWLKGQSEYTHPTLAPNSNTNPLLPREHATDKNWMWKWRNYPYLEGIFTSVYWVAWHRLSLPKVDGYDLDRLCVSHQFMNLVKWRECPFKREGYFWWCVKRWGRRREEEEKRWQENVESQSINLVTLTRSLFNGNQLCFFFGENCRKWNDMM